MRNVNVSAHEAMILEPFIEMPWDICSLESRVRNVS